MRKLTEEENAKRDAIVNAMIKSNKRGLVQRYGKNAEKVAYNRANKIINQQAESMDTKNSKLKEMIKKSLMHEDDAKFSKEYDSNPALKGKQKELPDALQKAIIKKGTKNDLEEGVFDRIKASVKGAASYVGTGVGNIGRAFTGKELKDPKLEAGMAKLGQKAKTLEKELNDALNDVNKLFPSTSLAKAPELLQKSIAKYKDLLNAVKVANTNIAQGKYDRVGATTGPAPTSTSSTSSAAKPAAPPASPTSAPSASKPKTASTKTPSGKVFKTKSGAYVKDGVAYNKDGKKLTGNSAKQVIAAVNKNKIGRAHV